MRVCIIEEVDNGLVLRFRGIDQVGAIVITEPQALKKALAQVKAFFLAPIETNGQAPSFVALAIPDIPDMNPLEPKAKQPELAPTDSIHAPVDTNAPTRVIKPKWRRPQ